MNIISILECCWWIFVTVAHVFSRNDLDMVQLLLWFGADPLLCDSRSRCAYDLANKEVGRSAKRWTGGG